MLVLASPSAFAQSEQGDGGEAGDNASSTTSHGDDEQGSSHDGDHVEQTDDGFRLVPPPDQPRSSVHVNIPNATVTLAPADGTRALQTRLDAIIEYADENGNGAYDLGERVLQRFAVRDLASRTTSEGNVTQSAVYALPGGGALSLRFHLATVDAATKYDIGVDQFPFTSPSSRLAVGALVSVEGGVRPTTVHGAPAIAATVGDRVAFLSWTPTVQVDGRDAPVGWSVHTSTSETGGSAIVYWSYPHGARILHDPTLGITSFARAILGDALGLALGTVVVVVLLGAGYVARRRGSP